MDGSGAMYMAYLRFLSDIDGISAIRIIMAGFNYRCNYGEPIANTINLFSIFIKFRRFMDPLKY